MENIPLQRLKAEDGLSLIHISLGMLSNITAIVQKQNVNTIENDINVEKDFCGTLREQQINCVKEDIYNKFHI